MMKFSNLIQRRRQNREEIHFEEILSNCPESCREEIAGLVKTFSNYDILHLMAVTDFYDSSEAAFKTILKHLPSRVSSVEDEDGRIGTPSCGYFYTSQKNLYQTRISRSTPHSLIALEVGLQAAFYAKTEPPHFGSHRNIGHFGQSEGRLYQTS